jgi:hypothetical protein
MKVLFKIIIFSFCLLADNSAFASCDDGASQRNFAGPKKIVQSLWRKLQDSEVPVWSKGSFHHQDFKYIGQLQSNQPLHVVWFSTTSGQSCRATNRLLLFTKSGTFFGMYTGLSEPQGINKQSLLFSQLDPVSFSSGPPNWIDSTQLDLAAK